MDVEEVFGTWTTYNHDYRVPKLDEPIKFRPLNRLPKTAVKEIRQKPYIPLDLHTMRPVSKKPPFDLLWETKAIVRTNPRFTFTPYGKPIDLDKDEVIKTRPRRYVSPAIGIDDIADKNIRELLINHMYKTTFQADTEGMNLKVTDRKLPNTTFEKAAIPITLDTSIIKPIPLKYRKEGKEWERHQYDSLVDTHNTFWSSFDKKLRQEPEGLVGDKEKAEIRCLVETDQLRLPYDIVKPKYGGHVPENVIGPFRNEDLKLYSNKNIMGILPRDK